MTYAQRRWHLLLWLVIGPAVAVVFALALLYRPSPPVQPGVAPGADAAAEGEPTR